MKILLINANTTAAVTERIAAEARRIAAPGTEVVPVTGTFGAPIIGTRAEMAVAEHTALDLFARHAKGADAVVIGVSFDVGLRALREIADVPVVGMTEAACHVACTLGGPFGIVTYGARSAGILREIVAGYGLASRLAGVYGLDATPADMLADPKALHAQIADAARGLVERKAAEAVILAGAVMAGLPPLLHAQVPCPLVEGVASGIGLAELLVRLAPAKARSGSFAAVGGRASSGLGPELTALLGRTIS
ncbi:MAG TPA: aspartate/glutamate racemase family protein [Geminicoccaceae bacterium]|nr:aspartate/glutamate racemase family protein [Geminicoccaceae bacterium]